MQKVELRRWSLSDIADAIERAKAYAQAQEVPLTVERLAAEMDMELALFRRIADGEITASSPGVAAKVTAIRRAAGEATASVMEHALRRGTSPNMHMLYLKNHAGYDTDKASRTPEPSRPPVLFIGEEDIPD